MLSLAFCLSFCSFGVGVVYADDFDVPLKSFIVNFFVPDSVVSFPHSFSIYDDWINNPNYYIFFTSVMQELGCNRTFNTGSSSVLYNGRYDDFSVPVSFSKTGLNLTDLSFSYPFVFYFVYGFNGHSEYMALNPFFRGTATVTFSDGSSATISLYSNNNISFSAKKNIFGNQYIMTSEDFNLKSSEKKFTLTADQAVRLSSATASLVGSFSGSEGLNAVDLTFVPQVITIPNPGSYVPNYVSIDKLHSASFDSASFYRAAFNTPGVLGDGGLTVSAANLGITAADVAFDQGIVEPSLVTLDKSSPDVYVTGFSVTGNLFFPASLISSSGSCAFSGLVGNSIFCFMFNSVAVFGTSESMLAHIVGTLDNIYYTLRFDLPLRIRHLVIPTTEEVSDVVEEAVDDIKQNAGGLGEAVNAVDNDFKQFMTALSSGKAGSLKIPACVVNVNGQKYTLWNEFDVSSYFQLAPIKAIVSYVVPVLEFFVASYVIYQLYYLWISLLSGNSYFAFLKSLRELNDEEGA